jgi:hypothetical protein
MLQDQAAAAGTEFMMTGLEGLDPQDGKWRATGGEGDILSRGQRGRRWCERGRRRRSLSDGRCVAGRIIETARKAAMLLQARLSDRPVHRLPNLPGCLAKSSLTRRAG